MSYIKWLRLSQESLRKRISYGNFWKLKKEELWNHLRYNVNPVYWNEKQWVNIIANYTSQEEIKHEHTMINIENLTFILVPQYIDSTIEEYVSALRSIRKKVGEVRIIAVIFESMDSTIIERYCQCVKIKDRFIGTNYSDKLDYFCPMYLPPQMEARR